MRLALLSPLPPDPSALAHHAAQFRRALNLGGIDVLTPLVGQRPLDNLRAARAWVAERDWRGVDVVHAELAPGQHTVYWVMQALASLPSGPALTATVHAPPGLLAQPLVAPLAGLYHASWLPDWMRQAGAGLAAPITRYNDRRLARRLSGVLCAHELGDAGVAQLARRLGLPRERIAVLPLGRHDAPARPLPPLPHKWLCMSGPGQALRPLQDLVTALTALQDRAEGERPDWQLTFAGPTAASCFKAPRHDPLSRLQADPRVRALGDRIAWQLDPDPQDLPALVAAHHMLIQPDRDQPWGLDGTEPGPTSPQAVRELALSIGRPLLVARHKRGFDLSDQASGATYTAGQTATLVPVLQNLLSEPDCLRAWGQQAQQCASARAAAQMSARYVGFFQQVVASSGRRATK